MTQIDLPDGKASGLKEAMRVLRDVEGIGICELTNADVVRHVMVQRIVEAYERYETAKNGGKGGGSDGEAALYPRHRRRARHRRQ